MLSQQAPLTLLQVGELVATTAAAARWRCRLVRAAALQLGKLAGDAAVAVPLLLLRGLGLVGLLGGPRGRHGSVVALVHGLLLLILLISLLLQRLLLQRLLLLPVPRACAAKGGQQVADISGRLLVGLLRLLRHSRAILPAQRRRLHLLAGCCGMLPAGAARRADREASGTGREAGVGGGLST